MTRQRTVLVTGATSGIGRESALVLARAGYHVFATGRKTQLLDDLKSEAGGLPLDTIVLDVYRQESIDEAAALVEQKTGGYGLDALVNNAGFGLQAPMELISAEDLRRQFDTNVFGLVAVTQAFLPAMRKRGSGRIVNVSSIVGKISMPLQGGYSASKFAVEAISDAFRRELAGFGIRVVIVEPGVIRTQFATTASTTVSTYASQETPYTQPLRRFSEMADRMTEKAPGPQCVADTIAFAIRVRRPAARYVTPRRNRLAIWLTSLLPTFLVDAAFRFGTGLTRRRLTAIPANRD